MGELWLVVVSVSVEHGESAEKATDPPPPLGERILLVVVCRALPDIILYVVYECMYFFTTQCLLQY